MRSRLHIIAIGLVIFAGHFCLAQAPSGATGQCKDGTYTTNATKKGACRGHKGVQSWFADSAASQSKPAPPPPSAAPAPVATPGTTTAATIVPKHTARSTNTTPAPGGGPGLVWLNTPSNVYHCQGTKYYGTTKAGKYVTEAQAKAAGARPEHGKACSQ